MGRGFEHCALLMKFVVHDGFSNTLGVKCSGLPAGATCNFGGALSPASNTAQLGVSETGLAPADYPFTISATSGILTRSIPAVLRVEGYTASLSQTSLRVVGGTPVNVTVIFKSLRVGATSQNSRSGTSRIRQSSLADSPKSSRRPTISADG